MAQNATNAYEVDARIAELYDSVVTDTGDVTLLRQLIGGRKLLNILEPFCGTGRILLPLALDGHTLVGIDQSRGMLDRARQKLCVMPRQVQRKVTLLERDVIADEWPRGFDLVILAGNCFYELATAQEQEACIRQAALSLKPGGWLFVDNDHMEGELTERWQNPEPEQRGIGGVCIDGTVVESWLQTIWFDAPRRLVRFKRWNRIVPPGSEPFTREYVQQKHPVSTGEVQDWLAAEGFTIRNQYGDWDARPYTDSARRAIFWAQKAQTP